MEEEIAGNAEDAGAEDAGDAEGVGDAVDEGDEGSVHVSTEGRQRRRGWESRASVQQVGVRDSDGDVVLFRLLRTTVHRVARDRLLRLTTRWDGGGGRWAGDSRTFEALKEDC